MRAGIARHVQKKQALCRGRFGERWIKIFDPLNPARLRAHSAGDRCVINRPEVSCRGVTTELRRFGVLLVAKYAIVEHDDNDRDAATNCRLHLRPRMTEATVADD